MVMTNILMSIILMISIVMIGCDNQPQHKLAPPAPTVTPVMVMVDEQALVMESLTTFNHVSNNYVRFLQSTEDIYQLGAITYAPEEAQYHVSYVATKITARSLAVYNDVINLWEPPEESDYYDALIDIKEAELYRIERFSELTDLMLTALPTEDAEAVETIRQKFIEWRDNPLNQKPMNLQNDILVELDIDAESVKFMYVIPEKPVPTLPPVFNKGENRS